MINNICFYPFSEKTPEKTKEETKKPEMSEDDAARIIQRSKNDFDIKRGRNKFNNF